MKLISINKYLLKTIFSYLNHSRQLSTIKYNKKFQSKLEISLYTYQLHYFNSIITPALLNNTNILLKNNIFEKNLLNKLLTDWENNTTEIIKDSQYFHKNENNSKKNLIMK